MFIAENDPIEVDASVMPDGDIVNIRKSPSTSSKAMQKQGIGLGNTASMKIEFDEDDMKIQGRTLKQNLDRLSD